MVAPSATTPKYPAATATRCACDVFHFNVLIKLTCLFLGDKANDFFPVLQAKLRHPTGAIISPLAFRRPQ
jgi:hypothetical protein